MKTYKECIPCFYRQARDAAILAKADEETREKILREVGEYLPGVPFDLAPPQIARKVYSIVEQHVGGDVYAAVKHESNMKAMKLYPELKEMIRKSADPLLCAVRLAVAGNVIDYGVPHVFDLESEIRLCLSKDFAVFDMAKFSSGLSGGETVLYVLDNAGEILMDKLLVEELVSMGKHVTCAVREKPIINDVTMDDAREVSLVSICDVISSGSDIPGTVIEETAGSFKRCFDEADVIISKGQGNYETMAELDAPIFYIFKAKCPQVARHVGCSMGDIILKSRR